MLIKFPDLISRYNIQPQGVLHIGAAKCEESEAYYSNGVKRTVWIEARESAMPEIKSVLSLYPNAIALNACIGDEDGKEVIFNVSSNDGESSSYLQFGVHSQLHPDVRFVDVIPMKTKRVDTLLEENNITLEGFDFLNCDLQGTELLALKSMGHLLHNFKWAYIEVNKQDTYKGNALVGEVDAYLAWYGFVGMEEKWVDDVWGDKFYIKKNQPAI